VFFSIDMQNIVHKRTIKFSDTFWLKFYMSGGQWWSIGCIICCHNEPYCLVVTHSTCRSVNVWKMDAESEVDFNFDKLLSFLYYAVFRPQQASGIMPDCSAWDCRVESHQGIVCVFISKSVTIYRLGHRLLTLLWCLCRLSLLPLMGW